MNPRKQSELDKMFDYQTVYNAYTALIAGLTTSVQCVAMCGPLYMIFSLALFSGSALKGAEFAIGFGLGTLPLLWLAQSQFMRVQLKMTPMKLLRIQRSLGLIAALVIAWRLRTTLGIEGAADWVCYPF